MRRRTEALLLAGCLQLRKLLRNLLFNGQLVVLIAAVVFIVLVLHVHIRSFRSGCPVWWQERGARGRKIRIKLVRDLKPTVNRSDVKRGHKKRSKAQTHALKDIIQLPNALPLLPLNTCSPDAWTRDRGMCPHGCSVLKWWNHVRSLLWSPFMRDRQKMIRAYLTKRGFALATAARPFGWHHSFQSYSRYTRVKQSICVRYPASCVFK
jgi:hypothetical protein